MTNQKIISKLKTALRASQRRMNGTAEGHINAMDCIQARIGDLITELETESKRIGKSTIVCPKHGEQPLIGISDTSAGCEKCYG